MYPEYARNTHSEYATVPRRDDFSLDAALVREAIAAHDPTVVILTTPNNPTGTTTPLTVIEEVLEHTRAIVVVDEAYQEFARHPERTALTLLPRHGNLVVSRTMSKAFAFAGGRLGYLAAAPAVVDACRIVRLPYHLSAQTQAIASVALRHAEEMLARVDDLRAARDELLRRAPRWGSTWSTPTPIRPGRAVGRPARGLAAVVGSRVLVRETGPAGYLRVSAGTPQEMEAFYAALARVDAPRMEE